MEDAALKWWHVRWGLAGRIITRFAIASGKIIGVLCLIAIAAAGVVYLLQPWLSSEHLRKFDPQLSLIPTELPSKVEVQLSSSSIDHFGVEFRLPNNATVIAKKFQHSTFAQFPNGTFEFLGPLDDQDSIVFASVRDDKDAQKLLTPEMLHSRMKLLQAAMSVAPEQVKWWRLRSSRNRETELLLEIKFVALTEYSALHSLDIRPIYTISISDFRGFQFGDPGRAPYDTHVDLFDSSDRHFAFDISGTDGHGQVLTQEAVNAIIASIRLGSEH